MSVPRKPTYFASPAEFRRWLSKNHRTARELWVGFHKKSSATPSMTWPESVDEALCFGWIDGIRKAVDAERYVIRFTPRRKGSYWSAVNTRRARELIEAGRMRPAGIAAFEARDERKTRYSFEQRQAPKLGAEARRRFRSNAPAWRFFESQPPGYRKLTIFWVISAKQEATRARRLETLIADSAAGRRLGMLSGKAK